MDPSTLAAIADAVSKYGPTVIAAVKWLVEAIGRWIDGSDDADAVRVADVLPDHLRLSLARAAGRKEIEDMLREELAGDDS